MAGGVLLAAAAVSLPLGSAKAAEPTFGSELTAALKGPGLQLGHTAAIAIDLETGKVIYAQAGKRHGMIKRTKKQIRNLRGTSVLFKSDGDNIKKFFLPNG